MEKRPKSGYGFIYKYTSPSGSSYVGQTTRSLQERAGHNGKCYKGCDLFYKAIQKYGFSNFTVEILAEVPKNQLDQAEKKYIQLFNTLAPNGYNLTDGGQNGWAKERKKVYQYSSLDGSFIKEWENASEVARAFDTVPQTFQGCLENKVYTQYGFCWSYEKLNKFPIHERIVDNSEKMIKQFSLDGILINTFSSLAKAARAVNGERSAIRRCCRNELKSAYGYHWECTEILMVKKYNNTAKQIQQIDPTTEKIIQVFPSISAAAKSLGKGTSLIRRVLDRDTNTAYGFKWRTCSRLND